MPPKKNPSNHVSEKNVPDKNIPEKIADEEIDDGKPVMFAIKNTLKNILNIKTPESRQYVNKLAEADIYARVNSIVTHTYNFLGLYLADYYHNSKKKIFLPKINDLFIRAIMLIVARRKNPGGGKPGIKLRKIIDTLTSFYNDHYLPLLTNDDVVYDDKLKQFLEYENKGIITNINNNISEHYIHHINRYVNIRFDVKEQIRDIQQNKTLSDAERKEEIKKINDMYRKVKNDLLNPEFFGTMELTCDKKFWRWIERNKGHVTPYKLKYAKNSLHYDVKVKPQDYLICMFALNTKIQAVNTHNIKINEEIIKRNQENKASDDNSTVKNTPTKLKKIYKLFHVLPLRTSTVPKYLTLDTTSIVKICMNGDRKYTSNITECADEIWGKVFSINKKCFKKKGYKFHHMIKTDGVGCSILFHKVGPDNKPRTLPRKGSNKSEEDDKHDCQYLENAIITEEMKGMDIAANDPGFGAPIQIAYQKNGESETFTNMKYTRAQRNAETKKNRNRKIVVKVKESFTNHKVEKINFNTISKIQSDLSNRESLKSSLAKIGCKDDEIIDFKIISEINFHLSKGGSTKSSLTKILGNEEQSQDFKKMAEIESQLAKRGSASSVKKFLAGDRNDEPIDFKTMSEFNSYLVKRGSIKSCLEQLVRKDELSRDFKKMDEIESQLAKRGSASSVKKFLAGDRNDKPIDFETMSEFNSYLVKRGSIKSCLEQLDSKKPKTIVEIETGLSKYDSKTCNPVKLTKYLGAKIAANRILRKCYQQPIFRKLRMNQYINTQRSESKLIKRFKEVVGPPGKVLIVYGDYDNKHTIKGCEPLIAKRLRKLFLRHKYKVFKINEFRTSKLCNKCRGETERFLRVKDKNGNYRLLWKLLQCQTVTCKAIHNRDENAARNMLHIAKSILAGKGRPAEYTRKKENPT